MLKFLNTLSQSAHRLVRREFREKISATPWLSLLDICHLAEKRLKLFHWHFAWLQQNRDCVLFRQISSEQWTPKLSENLLRTVSEKEIFSLQAGFFECVGPEHQLRKRTCLSRGRCKKNLCWSRPTCGYYTEPPRPCSLEANLLVIWQSQMAV